VGFVVDKAALEQVFSEYFGSPANHHSINFSIIITQGWHNRPIGGRSAEWTQLDSTPLYKLIIIIIQIITIIVMLNNAECICSAWVQNAWQ
jgi:hypothetical protein